MAECPSEEGVAEFIAFLYADFCLCKARSGGGFFFVASGEPLKAVFSVVSLRAVRMKKGQCVVERQLTQKAGAFQLRP